MSDSYHRLIAYLSRIEDTAIGDCACRLVGSDQGWSAHPRAAPVTAHRRLELDRSLRQLAADGPKLPAAFDHIRIDTRMPPLARPETVQFHLRARHRQWNHQHRGLARLRSILARMARLDPSNKLPSPVAEATCGVDFRIQIKRHGTRSLASTVRVGVGQDLTSCLVEFLHDRLFWDLSLGHRTSAIEIFGPPAPTLIAWPDLNAIVRELRLRLGPRELDPELDLSYCE